MPENLFFNAVERNREGGRGHRGGTGNGIIGAWEHGNGKECETHVLDVEQISWEMAAGGPRGGDRESPRQVQGAHCEKIAHEKHPQLPRS